MAKAPPVPPEQRAPAAAADSAHEDSLQGGGSDRRDRVTDVQSPDPGDADVNLSTQGRFGNIDQNVRKIDRQSQDR